VFKRLFTFVFCCIATVALANLPLPASQPTLVVGRNMPKQRNLIMLCMNYGRHTPIGLLSKRFGNSNTVGFSAGYKFANNWQVQAGINALFSGKVKENGILDSMMGSSGLLLDNTGTYADIRLYERGYLWHLDIGKIIPMGPFNQQSGILMTAGLGFIEHRIKFTYQKTVLPQLDNGNYKGYDRLTNGLLLRGFLGYQLLDTKGKVNLVGGIEYLQGMTQNRRAFNYDTRTADNTHRTDILLGLKLGIMVTVNGRETGKKKTEQDHFFN